MPNPKKKRSTSPQIPQKVESVMFCPYTPFSELRKNPQKEEDRINGQRAVCRVLIVERAGPKMSDILNNKTPWNKEHCGRPDCEPCKTKTGKCKVPNITYKIQCETCAQNGVKALYIGESNRTYYDRAKDHVAGLKNKDSSYGIVRHWQNTHQELDAP